MLHLQSSTEDWLPVCILLILPWQAAAGHRDDMGGFSSGATCDTIYNAGVVRCLKFVDQVSIKVWRTCLNFALHCALASLRIQSLFKYLKDNADYLVEPVC